MSSQPQDGTNSNAILHASLLHGTIAIKATEMDIRRCDDETTVSGILTQISTLTSPIETDYILQISSTNKVKFDSPIKSKLSSSDVQVQELETYNVSKRYVDVRNLASNLRECSEEIVKYYATKSNGNSNGNGGKSGSSSSIFISIEKALHKTQDVASYIINHSSEEPQSKRLDSSSPSYIRTIISGIDKFYDTINAEKRQFSKKTNYDHVKKVAERRKEVINGAFRALIECFISSDLKSVSKNNNDKLIPDSLNKLVQTLEKFLLTDVVREEREGVHVVSDDTNSVKYSLTSSNVVPFTTRRRASVTDRTAEEMKCKEIAELILVDEDKDDDTGSAKKSHSTTLAAENVVTPQIVIPTGLLPEDNIDFVILVAIGAILFKMLEGRDMNIQLDILLVFGIACGLIGYRSAQSAVQSTSSDKHNSQHIMSKHAAVVSPQSSPNKISPSRRPARPLSRRDMLSRSQGQREMTKRLSLIQKSMKSIRSIVIHDDQPKEEKPIVPAKTFAQFPSGADIGSHHNCWSSPPSTNFHVRGPNYLKDKKKVPSDEYLFPCRGCDLFLTDNPPVNMGRNRSILEGKLRDVPTFIINYRLPWGVFLSYYEIPKRFVPFLRRGHGHGDLNTALPSMAGMPSGDRAICNFLLSDTQEKNEVWKIVPIVVDGPWVVKRVVGGKPAIVGTKMPISYTYQPPENGLAEYLEADLDIVSSAAARNILAIVRSYTQVLTIDLGFVVQGNSQEELPEQMMLGLRLHGLDPLTAELLPEADDDHRSEISDSWEPEDTGYDTE